jgi:flagellar biosynthesis GTPase FlhF
VAGLATRVEVLRGDAEALAARAEALRRRSNAEEDRADSKQQARLRAESERIGQAIRAQEEEERAKWEAREAEVRAERELSARRRAEAEAATARAAAQAAARKEAAERRRARHRAEAAVAAQLQAVDDRAEVARKTLKLDLSGLGICDMPAYVYGDPLLRHIRILFEIYRKLVVFFGYLVEFAPRVELALYTREPEKLLDLAEMALEDVFVNVPENAGQHQLVEQEGGEIGYAPLLPEQHL